MAGGIVPRLDFSPLGELPQDYRRAQLFQQQQEMQANRQRTLAELASGAPVDEVAKRLFSVGDVEGGLSLAKLADARAMRDYQRTTDERDYKLRERQVDATLEGGRVPPGFRMRAGGGLEPVPGGPQDPDYIKAANEAKEKPRQMNVSDITKLSEEGGKFSEVAGFGKTFEDRFAGYKHPTIGNAAMTAGRFLPQDLVGEDISKGAEWWQSYNKYRGVVRNELYGAALSAGERKDFEAADITPGMTPEKIKANLAKQEEIVKKGLVRKAGALVNEGYNPETVSRAYGVKLEDLGITPKGKAQGSTSKLSPQDVQQSIANARAAIQAGKDPAAVKKKLQDAGIDVSGL